MGFLDFLKGILPDSLIKVNIDNRKIELKNSSLIIGNNTINDKEIIDKFFDKISKLNKEESLPFHLLHKELGDEFLT